MVLGEDTLRANADIQEDITMKQMTANVLPMHVHDERNGLAYTLHGDYYLPDLEVPPTLPLNHWACMVLDRLEKQHPGRFTRMLLGNR